MNLSFVGDFAVIVRKNADQTIRLRAGQGSILSIDGTAVEPAEDGTSDVDLTDAQSVAFRALMADPEAIAAAIEAGSITLPNGGQRGKPKATGTSFLSLAPVVEEKPTEPAAEEKATK